MQAMNCGKVRNAFNELVRTGTDKKSNIAIQNLLKRGVFSTITSESISATLGEFIDELGGLTRSGLDNILEWAFPSEHSIPCLDQVLDEGKDGCLDEK